MGCIQAAEVIKYVTGKGDLLINRLLMWDGLKAAIEIVAVEKNPACDVCQKGQA
jgi:adenylyltransferase/sulfurtransferase